MFGTGIYAVTCNSHNSDVLSRCVEVETVHIADDVDILQDGSSTCGLWMISPAVAAG